MHIEISDPEYTDDLVAYLRRCDCTVQVVAPGRLHVEARALPVDPALRRPELELDSYLKVWGLLRCVEARVVAAA
jgi:hypothetical protein